MGRTIGLLASLAVLALVPARADAQRYSRGTVNTPYGQFSMQEMQAAGGNPFAAEDIREQKTMMMYQQQMMRQQQLYMQQMAKQKKAQQDYLKAHPEAAKAEADAQASALAAQESPCRRTSQVQVDLEQDLQGQGQDRRGQDLDDPDKPAATSSTARIPGMPDP